MKAPLLNPYGLKDNRLVTIDKVERGLACDCRCPACNAQLIARKGKNRTPHFSHYNTTDCNAAYETALHMIAKDILAREKQLWLPAYDAHSESARRFYGKKLRIWNKRRQIIAPQVFKFDEARLESCLGDIVPDIILLKRTSQGEERQLIVEICVTHAVDEVKIAKIRQLDISTIEIRVPSILNCYSPTERENEIQKLLLGEYPTLGDEPRAKWIYNRWAEPKVRELLRQFGIDDHALETMPPNNSPMELQPEIEVQPEISGPTQLDLFQKNE